MGNIYWMARSLSIMILCPHGKQGPIKLALAYTCKDVIFLPLGPDFSELKAADYNCDFSRRRCLNHVEISSSEHAFECLLIAKDTRREADRQTLEAPFYYTNVIKCNVIYLQSGNAPGGYITKSSQLLT